MPNTLRDLGEATKGMEGIIPLYGVPSTQYVNSINIC